MTSPPAAPFNRRPFGRGPAVSPFCLGTMRATGSPCQMAAVFEAAIEAGAHVAGLGLLLTLVTAAGVLAEARAVAATDTLLGLAGAAGGDEVVQALDFDGVAHGLLLAPA